MLRKFTSCDNLGTLGESKACVSYSNTCWFYIEPEQKNNRTKAPWQRLLIISDINSSGKTGAATLPGDVLYGGGPRLSAAPGATYLTSDSRPGQQDAPSTTRSTAIITTTFTFPTTTTTTITTTTTTATTAQPLPPPPVTWPRISAPRLALRPPCIEYKAFLPVYHIAICAPWCVSSGL